jgi:hypothetical protein
MKRSGPYAQLCDTDTDDTDPSLNEIQTTTENAADPDMACYGTGSEAACVIPEDDHFAAANTSSSTTATAQGTFQNCCSNI